MSKKANSADNLTALEKVAAACVLVVYLYSIYLGFCSGFIKGLFMMFVPVVAQIWLYFERWICEPTGFSNLYTWMMTMAIALAIIAQKQKVSRGGSKALCNLLVVVWVLLTWTMFRCHDHGARSIDNVALAFQQATAELDVDLASYYATGSLKDRIESCKIGFDKSSESYKIAKEMGKGMRGKNFRVRGGSNGSNALVEIEYEYYDDEWRPFSQLRLEDTEDGWKVSGGMGADTWSELSAAIKK